VQLLAKQKEWKKLNEHLLLITKRRGQHKKAVSAVVGEAMKLLEDLKDDEPALLELIEVIRTVTDGKIFIELERARATKVLAQLKEKNGDIKAACTVLNDIQIETYGSMERREKAEFVLEQMRLLLDNNDLIRANMVAKKLSDKVLNDKDFEDVKIEYNKHMVRFHTEKANYMSLFTCYNAIYGTEIIKKDADQALETLQSVVGFLALSPRDAEQNDHCLLLQKEDTIEKLPGCQALLKKMLTKELIRWSDFEATNKADLYGKGAFTGDRADARWADLNKRVIEHNIFVVADNYCRVTLARLAALVELPVGEAEEFLCDMVTAKQLYAKIDRPAGVVVFKKAASADELLNGWSNDITALLNLVEKSCHLIYKENIAHKIK
jgi:26S proteasome regulatory subunit N5